MHWVFSTKIRNCMKNIFLKKTVGNSHTENISEEISDAPRHLQTVAW